MIAVRFCLSVCTWAIIAMALPVGLSLSPAGADILGADIPELIAPQSVTVPPSETPRWGGRVGYVDDNGDLQVRMSENPNASWKKVATGVKSFQLLDWRLAVLRADNNRTLLLGEGELENKLTPVATNVCAYQLTLTRVGILQCDGMLLVKEWGFDAKPVAQGVKSFQVLSDRVGVLGFDGVLWVQEGGSIVASDFREIANDVVRF